MANGWCSPSSPPDREVCIALEAQTQLAAKGIAARAIAPALLGTGSMHRPQATAKPYSVKTPSKSLPKPPFPLVGNAISARMASSLACMASAHPQFRQSHHLALLHRHIDRLHRTRRPRPRPFPTTLLFPPENFARWPALMAFT